MAVTGIHVKAMRPVVLLVALVTLRASALDDRGRSEIDKSQLYREPESSALSNSTGGTNRYSLFLKLFFCCRGIKSWGVLRCLK
jgi:hypothetical protein